MLDGLVKIVNSSGFNQIQCIKFLQKYKHFQIRLMKKELLTYLLSWLKSDSEEMKVFQECKISLVNV